MRLPDSGRIAQQRLQASPGETDQQATAHVDDGHAVGIAMLGYVVGRSISIDKYILPIVAVIIVLSLIPPFLEYRKHKRAQPS